jgi:hypothetical protein
VTVMLTKRRILALLRDRYEAEGYTFIEYPDRRNLPAFMEGYQPDAVALGDGKSIAIDVDVHGDPARQGNFGEIAERFQRQKAWELRVVYGAQVHDEHFEVPTSEQIQKSIEEAEALLAQGHPRAALVLGWATIEAIARTLNPDLPTFGPRTTAAALELLEHLGRLGFEETSELQKLSSLREKVVHGEFHTPVTAAEAGPVLSAARAALEAAP